MTRILLIGLTLLTAGGSTGPSAPRIIGPRRTTDLTPTFRFVSHEAGLHSRAIRFRCAIDRKRLHRCPNRYTPNLRLGRHTLLVRAVDPKSPSDRPPASGVSAYETTRGLGPRR
jgi:hypothetical protein